MPRPNRAYGRPGTRVIPKDFETEHARVIDGTRTARCVIHGPTPGAPVFDPDLGYSVTPGAPELHEGTARVQALSAADQSRVVGEQEQATAGYRVTISLDAPRIPPGSVVTFLDISDGWLTSDYLIVKNGDLGTIRFERAMYCIDDITDPGEVA